MRTSNKAREIYLKADIPLISFWAKDGIDADNIKKEFLSASETLGHEKWNLVI